MIRDPKKSHPEANFGLERETYEVLNSKFYTSYPITLIPLQHPSAFFDSHGAASEDEVTEMAASWGTRDPSLLAIAVSAALVTAATTLFSNDAAKAVVSNEP